MTVSPTAMLAENALLVHADGNTLTILLRTAGGEGFPNHHHLPYFKATSTDGGASFASWTQTPDAVKSGRPAHVTLSIGASRTTVLSAGRPALGIHESRNAGVSWISSYDIPTEHNKLMPSPALRFCRQYESAPLDGSLNWTQTSAVTTVAQVSTDGFLVCYNRVCCPTVRTDCHTAPPAECECDGTEFFCMRGHVVLEIPPPPPPDDMSILRLKSDDRPRGDRHLRHTSRVGDGWGTNIHWTSPPGGRDEIVMLSRAYRVARMDFKWSSIETSKGVYNFAAYDLLLKTMLSHGVRPYWILDYSNNLYPPIILPGGSNCTTAKSCQETCPQQAGQPSRTCNSTGAYYCCGVQGCNGIKVCPGNNNLHACACDGSAPGDPTCDSPDCIAAFGAFAAGEDNNAVSCLPPSRSASNTALLSTAAVVRFKGHDIVFECLNEPNGMGHDTHATITKLCLSAGKAFNEAGELFVGPALAGLGKASETYLNSTMQEGILDAFGAVSVHPYRGTPPETAIDDYATLRAMIRKYGNSAQKTMPLISGEWGYTSATSVCLYPNRQSEAGQAAYLARMWLVNTLTGAGPSGPLTTSINYDWSDGGTDPASCEGNFGSVKAIVKGQPIVAKLAYTAALTLQTTLGNFETCTGRITPSSVSPASFPAHHVFVARFENGTANTARVNQSANRVGFAVWTNGSVTQGQCDGPNRTSSAPVPERADCGHQGISEAACIAASNTKGPGCCWEPCKKPGACPKIPGGPECYKIEEAVNTNVHVLFETSPGDCFRVIDMLGDSVVPKICASTGGAISLALPAHGATSSPMYLLPIRADEL